ncbi:hypothetical protein [Streptomyces xantholiticus]|uniref:hypothetical protein n=1 Tax=Streptomyces xantholiticus TaxID=68285 RepID=UPI0016745702|nr:hypothetical protein [Streptomyces xantholiticus]GGW43073.1 hypothetical protein GCM10010381_30010 [Streptomyces xantholiticus]
MHIALAPFVLRAGVCEDALISASDRFEEEFVSKQDGIIRRVLVKDGAGSGYADLVFFRDLESIDRVVEAEQNSDVCAAFFSIMDGDGSLRVYEVLKSYG